MKVLRRRRLLRLSVGSRRWRVCRCRAIEEECVISRLIRIPVPNPSHVAHHHFHGCPPVSTHVNTVLFHFRRVSLPTQHWRRLLLRIHPAVGTPSMSSRQWSVGARRITSSPLRLCFSLLHTVGTPPTVHLIRRLGGVMGKSV